jgi:hypothetical protein
MSNKEIRDTIEQMDNISVDLDSISIAEGTVSYVYHQTSRTAQTGWQDGMKLVEDIESFAINN